MAARPGKGAPARAPAPAPAVKGKEKESRAVYTAEEPMAAQVVLILALLAICVLAVSIRLFAVVRYESVIHEFDPYFNYRVTQHLTAHGAKAMLNWFDDKVWHPLGRLVGGTVYPGLMLTAGLGHWLLERLGFVVDIRNVCVLTAPVFSCFTALTAYGIVADARAVAGVPAKGKAAGLLAAALVAIVPGYISRSVGGSYDNEAVAIFAILACFYTFAKACASGRLLWVLAAIAAYVYMVAAWGGYIYVINVLAIVAFVAVFLGRYTHRVFVAYTVTYTVGSLIAAQVPFVGWKAITGAEQAVPFAVMLALAAVSAVQYIRSLITPKAFRALMLTGGAALAAVVFLLGAAGVINPFEGRLLMLLDPSSRNAIPIIASVSEHQASAWGSFLFDLHALLAFMPAGFYFLLRDLNEAALVLVCYGVTITYFAGIMVRIVLVFAPAAACFTAVAISEALWVFAHGIRSAASVAARAGAAILSTIVTAGVAAVSVTYVLHCVWVSSEAYSSPSIVLMTRSHTGQPIVWDDFREAYRWLHMNTPEGSKIMSWWDYGYQMSSMASRPTIVDNNTWNNSHIATVGRAMASTEPESNKVMRRLDVDYVLVIFGGLVGYSSDDINKFLWMVRISAGVFPKHVREARYYSDDGNYVVDHRMTDTMRNSLVYKMCYYRFAEATPQGYRGQGSGYDTVRGTEIGMKDVKLSHLEEAFTSERWIVRIYRVLPDPNHGPVLGGP